MTWLSHVIGRIDAQMVNYDPFSHLVVPNVFPWEFYEDILRHRPQGSLLNPDKPHRFIFYPGVDSSAFWAEFKSVLCGDELRDALLAKFGIRATEADVCVLHDYPGNILGPHTDSPPQRLTGLFYLPESDADAEFGTALIRSKSGQTCEGREDHAWSDDFEIVSVVPYAANTALFFPVTDCSWHAAVETGAERWLIDYHLS